MAEPQPVHRRDTRTVGQLQREMIRRWRRALRARGFTDEQAGHLVVAKLLHLRGRLRG